MSAKSKHTPGPWVLGALRREFRQINAVSCEQPWEEFASVAVKLDGIPSKEGEANARLIAAAPDLLEALTLCLRFAETEANQEDACYDAKPAVEKARAAIAKAEGRAE